MAIFLSIPDAVADTGWYVGVATGSTAVDVDVNTFQDGGITSGDVDDGGIGFKVFGGYKIIKFLAVEGGYTDLDEVTFDGVSDGSGGLWAAGPVSTVFEAGGTFVNVVGILPINNTFAFIGKMGMMNWDGDFTLADTSGILNGSDDGTDPMYTVGVEILPNSKFTLRAEYENFTDVMAEDIDRVTGSLLFRF
jgi:OOP family OmpA-OmpF porin